jgi:hypothetical protein
MKAKRKKAKRLVIHGQNRFAEMDEKDAKELAKIINEKGEIYLSDYFRPIVIIRHADPEIVRKWEGTLQDDRWEINDRELVRSLLHHTMPYLIKQELAKIAIQMIDAAKDKDERYRLDELYCLAKHFKRVEERGQGDHR